MYLGSMYEKLGKGWNPYSYHHFCFFPFVNAGGIKAQGFFLGGGGTVVYRAAGIRYAVLWLQLHDNILIFIILAVSVKYQDAEGKSLITLWCSCKQS